MPVLRELISRFTFDVDKKSVNRYEQTIGGMKKSALKLGSVLGLSLGGKALFGMGVSALAAEENLRRVAGSQFDPLEKRLDALRKRLNSVREGAGAIIKDKAFQVLATGFITTFDNSNESLDQFISLLDTASLKALSTGQNVSEIFSGLQSAITTGDVSALKDIGKFNEAQVKFLQDTLSAIDIGQFGQEESMRRRAKIVLDTLAELKPAQERQAKGVGVEFFEFEKGKKELDQFLEQSSEEITKSSVNIFTGLKKIFFTDDFFKQDIQQDPNQKGIIQIPKAKTEDPETGFLRKIRAFGAGGEENLREFEKSKEVKISMPVTMHINGVQDPKAVAVETKKQLGKLVDDAKNQLIISEDKR